MSNAVSRGHGRGKPNPGFFPDHNVMPTEPQFVKAVVPTHAQMNFQPRMPSHQMPPQQFAPYNAGPQYSQHNYYPQQPPQQLHQQQYGGYREFVPQPMYNPPYQPYQGPQQMYHPQSDTVNYPQAQQPPPPITNQAPRERKVLSIIDPTTQKAIDVPQVPQPAPVVAPPPPAPLAPEDEKKKEHINQEMLEKVRQQLTGEQPNHDLPNFNVPPPVIPPSQTTAASTPPQEPTPPVAAAPPKTPEAPVKSVETSKEPEILTPVSSPPTSESTTTTTSVSESVELVSQISDSRVTPTLQKEDSKEEAEDDKFEEDSRTETPETESQIEKTPEELAEEKAQKEAEEKEKRRVYEQTLEKRIEELIATNEVDVSSGVFGRAFMITIRELEKNFTRTPCPLTPAQLTEFGLDLKTMRIAEKKPNFTPNWVVNKGGARQQPYKGRSTTDGTGRGSQQNRERGSHNKRPPVVRQSIERMQRVALPSSKDAWKPDRQKGAETIPEEEAAITKVCKNVRALMNKVTPTSQGPLTQEFIKFNVSSNDKQLDQVVQIVFDKAVEEPKFCALYAEMCKAQVNHELNLSTNKSLFRNKILTKTQLFFQDKKDVDEERLAAIEKEQDPVKKEAMLLEEKQKFRRRKFGVMAFIGHLYRNGLLSTKIVNACTLELFGSVLPKGTDEKGEPVIRKEDIDEESVHCGLQLIETVGNQLDKAKETTPVFLDQWLEKLNAAKPFCSNKIRFMIMNLVELRKDRWIPRKSTESGPKKLDEIHKDIRQEKIENEKARDQYDRERDRRHGAGVRPNSNSLKKQIPPSRNSLDRNRQQPEQKRAAAAANTKLASSNVQPKNISLSAMSDSSSLGGKNREKWQSGASGGGNTSEAAASAPPPKNPWVRRDSNDQRKRSTVDERQAALAAAKEINGPVSMSARRSTSQTSIPDKIDEEVSQELKTARERIMNSVKSDIQEVVSGDFPLKEMVDTIKEYTTQEKYGKPTLAIVYEMVIRSVSEKNLKETEREKLACVLRMTLVSKVEKQAFIDGVTRFCKFAVDTTLYQDIPHLWSVTGEVLINTMHVRHDLIEETKVESISLNEMEPAFLSAQTDGSKKNELFVHVVKRWTDAELEETNAVEALSWEFQELSFKEELLKNGLKTEMEAVKASNGKTLATLLLS
uniref:MIF4G domain-containing protein n=1 Tax=Caenorhabditis tropicalis TaxID=1561998 RepID=A0A1I7V0V9_9PELO